MKINGAEVPIVFYNKLSPANQQNFANLIAVLSDSHVSEEAKIVPVTPEEVRDRFMGLVAVQEETLIGFISATEPISHRNRAMAKVGSLIVPPNYQTKGVGTALVQRITTELLIEEVEPYAFCNPLSVNAFSEAGYDIATPDLIPPGEASKRGNVAMVYMGDLIS